jgi:hypothetical protein
MKVLPKMLKITFFVIARFCRLDVVDIVLVSNSAASSSEDKEMYLTGSIAVKLVAVVSNVDLLFLGV